MVADHAGDLITEALTATRRSTARHGDYVQHTGHRLTEHRTMPETLADVRRRATEMSRETARLSGLATRIHELVDALSDTLVTPDLISTPYMKVLAEFGDAVVPFNGLESAAAVRFNQRDLAFELRVATNDGSFLNGVQALLERRRRQRQRLTVEETITVRAAYWLLDSGSHLYGTFPIWDTSGLRDHQTLMAVTDPGEGHLHGTTTDLDYLRGIIVHLEHLERGVDRSRTELEPYRIPSPRTISRVRLHSGTDVPTSCYVGRPLFEGVIEDSMLKTSRTFAAACSSLFADGLAECKLAIEGMTATQAVTFMRTVSAEVRKSPDQVLAAAFNINTPFVDDRAGSVEREGGPVTVTDPVAIGLLGIELAADGGFGKVAWDGSADTYPSRCFIEQISTADALTLVHAAHEHGLLTYFSAGFQLHHLTAAIQTGVDGIGVGGAQILRLMDKDTGNHGPFLQDRITPILDVRDEAESSDRGRAAVLLARLDRLWFEGSITSPQDDARRQLFAALIEDDRDRMSVAMDAVPEVTSMPTDAAPPMLSWALRLIATPGTLASAGTPDAEWRRIVARLQAMVDDGDVAALLDALSGLSSRHRPPNLTTPRHADPVAEDAIPG